jgi:hypothetical protein
MGVFHDAGAVSGVLLGKEKRRPIPKQIQKVNSTET